MQAMRERFPSWEEVRDAPTAELERVLRPGGLAAQKAPRIQAVLRELSDGGPPQLDWLAGLAPDDAIARLVALPGVGPKTASCVLLFSLGVPVMPVDTHVHRVAGRLGLIPAGMGAGPRARAPDRGNARRAHARGAPAPDPPWPHDLHGPAAALRGVRAARSVPVWPGAGGV